MFCGIRCVLWNPKHNGSKAQPFFCTNNRRAPSRAPRRLGSGQFAHRVRAQEPSGRRIWVRAPPCATTSGFQFVLFVKLC